MFLTVIEIIGVGGAPDLEKDDMIAYEYQKYIEHKLDEENGRYAVFEFQTSDPVVEKEHAQKDPEASPHHSKNKEH